MPWHLMYQTAETRNGQTCERSSNAEWLTGEDTRGEIVTGYALLTADEYERWKVERFSSNDFVGYLLTDVGSWNPHDGLWGVDLANAHRVVPRLPEQVIASMEWEESLELHDVDRYFEHYDGLERRSVRFFEKHLRYDPDTIKVLEGLRAFEDLHSDGFEWTEGAYAPAFFHRAAEVVGTYRNRALDDPAHIPGPLDDDIQAVLLGYRSARLTREHCEDDEVRAAAALLAILTAWTQGRKTPAWAARLLERMRSDREVDWEGWQVAFSESSSV